MTWGDWLWGFVRATMAGGGVAASSASVAVLSIWITDAIMNSYCYLFAQMLVWATGFAEYLADRLPTGATEVIANVSEFFPIISAWFPVGFAFKCLGAFLVFAGVLIAYRFVKSWLPSVSG